MTVHGARAPHPAESAAPKTGSAQPALPDNGGGATLMRRLLLWTLGAVLLVWLTFIVAAYRTGVHEADELTDGDLASAAALLLNLRVATMSEREPLLDKAPVAGLKRHDYQQSLSVMIWDNAGALLTHVGTAAAPGFEPREGFSDLQLGQPPAEWRAFSRWNAGHDRLLMVLLSAQERSELAADIADQVTAPGWWMLPVVLLVLGLALRRGLRPLYELSADVAKLDAARGERLTKRHDLREFDSVVGSINQLIANQHKAMQRERQLASEVAHELRTPLASIALSASALAGPLTAEERERATARIGSDALKAGHVLNQLLALARASRAELVSAAVPLDLAQLARGVAGDFAQAAWERGDNLAVTGLNELPVQGHPLLLELALRNVLDNAIRHTGRGAQIEVHLNRNGATAWFDVYDDGGAAAETERDRPTPGRTDSLGLGLKIVERVADLHRAVFGHCEPPAPHRTGFRFALSTIPN